MAQCASGPRRSSRATRGLAGGPLGRRPDPRRSWRTRRPPRPLVGIGISVPGMVRRNDGLVRLAPNLEWHDVSFGSIVLAALGLDVPDLAGQRRRSRRPGRAPARRRRRDRRPDLRLRQRRRRCRRHHRRTSVRGSGRVRRRGRPPAVQPDRQALSLRQPRLLGDRGRGTRDRRGDQLPAGEGRPAGRGARGLREGAAGAARDRAPSAPAWPAWSTPSTHGSSSWVATSARCTGWCEPR